MAGLPRSSGARPRTTGAGADPEPVAEPGFQTARATFAIPAALRPFAGDRGRVDVALATAAGEARLADALAALARVCPGVVARVLTEQGELRPHVNVFVGLESVRFTGGLATPVDDGNEIAILPAVSGGAERLRPGRTRRTTGTRLHGDAKTLPGLGASCTPS